MIFVSLTRLRVRSIRFLPFFGIYTMRALSQVKRAPGFLHGALLPDRRWTFWTLTAWDRQESMRAYMNSGSHKAAMPHLLHWCDEASVAHWTPTETALPTWIEAHARMVETGRASKVRNPSPHHASLSFPAPRTTGGATIRPS
jgi:heme-degrading monooxygenase HmoA